MTPINQFIVGNDPTLNPSSYIKSVEEQINLLELQKQQLLNSQQRINDYSGSVQDNKNIKRSVWESIDAEIEPLSKEQKEMLSNNKEYNDNYVALQNLVQVELLNLVKDKIESSEEGNKLLKDQFKLIKQLKTSIVEETNKEMNAFKMFKEASKNNPNLTYEEFIKSVM